MSQKTSINPAGSFSGFPALTVENKGLPQNEGEQLDSGEASQRPPPHLKSCFLVRWAHHGGSPGLEPTCDHSRSCSHMTWLAPVRLWVFSHP